MRNEILRSKFWKLSKMHYPSESIGLKLIPSELELFRAVRESISEPFQVITNQPEKRFVSRVIKNGQ